MRYWWVNQNQTHRQELAGDYLWSPKRKADGGRNPFYEFMREVAPGDLVFSFVDAGPNRSSIELKATLADSECEALLPARRVHSRFRETVQRLDGENGLMLTPSIDHLFDRGFISFEDGGRLLVAPQAHRDSLARMGVPVDRRVDVGAFRPEQRRYLEFHRDLVFLKARVRA